jgi:hypothetical protein
VGPRLSFIASFAFSAMAGLIFLTILSFKNIVSYALFLTKLGCAASFNLVYISNVALFPVEILSTTFGVCNVFARIGAMAAPLAAELPDPYPLILLVGASIAYSIVSGFLIDGGMNVKSDE